MKSRFRRRAAGPSKMAVRQIYACGAVMLGASKTFGFPQSFVEIVRNTQNIEPIGVPFIGAFRGTVAGSPRYTFQPAVSRTFSMVSRIVFQVCWVSSMALGNMQPSQQMCLMPRAVASLSQ